MKRAPVVLAFTPLLLTACGFLFTKGPPDGYETMTYFTCTESNTGPVLDVVWAGLNIGGALLISADKEQYENPDAAITSGIIWAVVSGASAAVGFDRVKKCVAAKRAQASRGALPPAGTGTGATVQTVVLMGERDTMVVGETVQLVAKAFDANNDVLPITVFAWSSSNDAIASVTNSGVVTAHASGTAVIAANANNVVRTMHVVVVSQH